MGLLNECTGFELMFRMNGFRFIGVIRGTETFDVNYVDIRL